MLYIGVFFAQFCNAFGFIYFSDMVCSYCVVGFIILVVVFLGLVCVGGVGVVGWVGWCGGCWGCVGFFGGGGGGCLLLPAPRASMRGS